MPITVTLDADLESRLRARVAAGEFISLDAAVSEAVREFVLVEPPIDELRAKIATAIDALDHGQGISLDVEDLKRAGRKKLGDRTK